MKNEEIKEILDYLIINETTGMCYLSIRLTNQIRNIITNLQQENEKLKYNARGQVNDYFKDKYFDEILKNAKLKEENKELNRMCELYSKSLYNAELTDYKSRCKKANKLLKTIYKALPGTYNQLLIEIDNYLQGSDEE